MVSRLLQIIFPNTLGTFLNDGIRKRVAIFSVLLTLCSLLTVGLFLIYKSNKNNVDMVSELQAVVARRVVGEIQMRTHCIEDLFNNICRITDILSLSAEEQNVQISILNSHIDTYGNKIFKEIVLLDLHGNELASVSDVVDTKNIVPRSWKKKKEFQYPIKEGEIYFSSVLEDSLSRESCINMAIPVVDIQTGRVEGVLVVKVLLSHFFDSSLRNETYNNGVVYIADSEGLVVSHPNHSFAQRNVFVLLDEKYTVVREPNDLNKLRIYQDFLLGEQEFRVIIDTPFETLPQATQHALYALLIFLILFTAASISAAYRAVEPFVQSINLLANDALAITQGEYSKRGKYSKQDEIGLLFNAFTLMTDKLFDDIQKIKEEEETLLKVHDKLEIKVKERTLELSKLNIKLSQEIQERIDAEKGLKAAHDLLESRVEKRTKDLALVNTYLQTEISERIRMEEEQDKIRIKAFNQSKLASLGSIATGVAHEINQPLSYIKIIFEATLRDIEEGSASPEEMKTDFVESLRQISRISTIIDHLRIFGRADSMEMQPVNLVEMLDNALILMNERLRIRNIKLSKKTGCEPVIEGNALKLEQVFINLLQNAHDVLAEMGGGNIKVHFYKEGANVVTTVSDDGPGMAPDVVVNIFEPFYSTKEVGQGTGLGLSIVYGIVREHNGIIECDSVEGSHTTFKITIPASSINNAELTG